MKSLIKNPKLKEMMRTCSYFIMVQSFFIALVVSFGFLGQTVFFLIIIGPTIIGWLYATKNGYFTLLCYICITMAMGQRTMYVGKVCRFVPSEILYYFLAASCFLFSRQHYKFNAKLPGIAIFFLIIGTAWGITLTKVDLPWDYLRLNRDINLSFFYAKGFWLILPVLYGIKRVIRTISQIHDITFILIIEAFFLSLMTFLEFYSFPGLRSFSGFLTLGQSVTATGFNRALCSFWGNPMLGAVICAFFPLCLAEWAQSRTVLKKAIVFATMVLSIWCIYSTGSRGAWVAWFIGMSIFFILKGAKGVATLFIVIAVGAVLMPESVYMRFSETYGARMESGTLSRIHRVEHTWLLIRTSPLIGNGWGAAGLAHTDWLQLWSDTGIISPIAFAMIFMAYFTRLTKFLNNKRVPYLHKEYARAFVASMVFYGLLLTCEPMLNNPEQYPPLWTLYALGFIYPSVWQRDNALAQEEMRKNAEITSSNANL